VADEIFDYSQVAADQEVQAALDQLAAARARDDQTRFAEDSKLAKEQQASAEPTGGAGGPSAGGVASAAADAFANSPLGSFTRGVQNVVGWVKKLPKNVSLGMLDAGVNTAALPFEIANDVGNMKPANDPLDLLGKPAMTDQQARLAGEIESDRAAEARGERPLAQTVHEFPQEVSRAYRNWREELRSEDDMGDVLTQGVAQFAIPFTAFSKAFGVARGAGFLQNILRLGAAETVTSGTVLGAHDGRAADLIELGRQAEGKFGDVLRAASPDGSLANQYIEWMIDRDDEGLLEGRFKNTVDGLGASAALGAFLKAAGMTFKGARKVMQAAIESAPPVPARSSGVKPVHTGFEETYSGIVFKDEKDAMSAAEELAHQFGPGFEQRMAEAHAKATDKNFATLHSFSQVLKANVDKPVATSSLVAALERNIKGDTETGAFYKELLGRLKAKNLGGMTTVASEAPGTSRGGYVPKSNAVKIYQRAFESPEKLLHTFTHEAVHAATIREIRESAEASAKIVRLHKRLTKAFREDELRVPDEFKEARDVQVPKGSDKRNAAGHYAFTDPEEFIAEIESNPEFRKLMKQTMIDGESAWDKYKKAIGGILGIGALATSPEFDKLMDPKVEDDGA